MAYSFIFGLLAVACGVIALAACEVSGWIAILPIYAALVLFLLGIAYVGVGARLLGKRADGRRNLWGWLLLGPYFLFSSALLAAYRRFTHELILVEVLPNLSFGRRMSAREADAAGWVAILDLAAEFTASCVPSQYRSLPVLDATAPTKQELDSAVAWLTEAVATGPVYVHCALGHGRSACVVIAYLLSIRNVSSPREGEKRLRSLRPGVRLNVAQRKVLRNFESAGHSA